MANCVVTGGCGFIGSRLVQRLQYHGHQVKVFDHSADGLNCLKKPGLLYFRRSVHELVASDVQGVEVIFHCAAMARTAHCVAMPELCMNVNTLGTQRVLEMARVIKARVIFSSSNIVYAGPTPYRASKRAAEELCEVYRTLYGVSAVALRYSNVYGPGMQKGDPLLLPTMRDSKIERGYVEVAGDGLHTRDYTHVDDIVAANIAAWHSDYSGEPLDICTGHTWSVNQIAELFQCEIRRVPPRIGDTPHISQDPNPARAMLGFKYSIRLAQGFPSIYQER